MLNRLTNAPLVQQVAELRQKIERGEFRREDLIRLFFALGDALRRWMGAPGDVASTDTEFLPAKGRNSGSLYAHRAPMGHDMGQSYKNYLTLKLQIMYN